MNPSLPENRPVLSEEDRENLTAFLDGELGEDATEALVAEFGRSPQLRTEAEELKKTWELLDYLPRPQAPENFTAKTLDRLDTTKLLLLTRERHWRRVAVLGWVFTLLLAGVGGFIFAFYWPRETPPLPESTPTVEAPILPLDLPDDGAKEVHERLKLGPPLRQMDRRVQWNMNRILGELRAKVKDQQKWREILHDLQAAANRGIWDYLNELQQLAIKYNIPLDAPMPMPMPRSPGDDQRPKAKNPLKKGTESGVPSQPRSSGGITEGE
jgi:hypothetical protein